jgi:signal-transduction protein with cAMP-binding, CBS, and nucleotidyltransferase domain
MWTWDCGVLPVVDDGQIRGVITDRDISMALLFKGKPASAVTVAEVVNGHVYSCSPEDDAVDALEIMRGHQIHRLPVIEDGRLEGLLSINDIVLEARAESGHEQSPTYRQVIEAMQDIHAHRQALATA